MHQVTTSLTLFRERHTQALIAYLHVAADNRRSEEKYHCFYYPRAQGLSVVSMGFHMCDAQQLFHNTGVPPRILGCSH